MASIFIEIIICSYDVMIADIEKDQHVCWPVTAEIAYTVNNIYQLLDEVVHDVKN